MYHLATLLELQERARGPLSPCQVWWGSDFTRRRGGQKRSVFVCLFVTGSIARSASRRYLVYSEADFEVFRPTRATRCTDGVKFGTKEGTLGPLLHAKFGSEIGGVKSVPSSMPNFTPSVQRQGCRTPKTENFTHI